MTRMDDDAPTVDLLVNGRSYPVVADPQTPLVYVLRNDLGLVGTRFGCGEQACGSCAVLVDGAVVPSCEVPLASIAGRPVTTVECGDDPWLAHLRDAFVAEQAAQCGACSSGMLITAAALLARTASPDEHAVRTALEGNICRCGTHARIVRAVLRAAAAGAGAHG